MEEAPFSERFILIGIYIFSFYVLSSNTIVLMLNFFLLNQNDYIHICTYLVWNASGIGEIV